MDGNRLKQSQTVTETNTDTESETNRDRDKQREERTQRLTETNRERQIRQRQTIERPSAWRTGTHTNVYELEMSVPISCKQLTAHPQQAKSNQTLPLSCPHTTGKK